jgi:hypothetical protein
LSHRNNRGRKGNTAPKKPSWSAEIESMAVDLGALTGDTSTQTVARLNEIAKHCAALPVRDDRSPQEMLYDERGLPK